MYINVQPQVFWGRRKRTVGQTKNEPRTETNRPRLECASEAALESS